MRLKPLKFLEQEMNSQMFRCQPAELVSHSSAAEGAANVYLFASSPVLAAAVSPFLQ